MFEISAAAYQLQEFIEVFGQRFVGLIDNGGVYATYRVPRPEAPYPQDYIIDQNGIVRYWSDEFEPQEIIRTIDRLLNTDVEEYDLESQDVLSLEIIPNPFRKMTDIRYMIQDAGYRIGDFSLQIFDVTGRLVRTFPPMHHALGPILITWDGTDHKGNGVPSGVYFVRFESGKYSITESVILSR